MKKANKMTILVSLSLLSANVMADQTDQKTQKNSQKTTPAIKIYQSNDSDSKIIQQIPLTQSNDYVPFYCQNDQWCKVGLRQDGKTGWINHKQIQQAQKAWQHEFTHTDITQIPGGKKIVKKGTTPDGGHYKVMESYQKFKNDDKAPNAIKHFDQQWHDQWQQMQKMQQKMQKQMQQAFQQFDHFSIPSDQQKQ